MPGPLVLARGREAETPRAPSWDRYGRPSPRMRRPLLPRRRCRTAVAEASEPDCAQAEDAVDRVRLRPAMLGTVGTSHRGDEDEQCSRHQTPIVSTDGSYPCTARGRPWHREAVPQGRTAVGPGFQTLVGDDEWAIGTTTSRTEATWRVSRYRSCPLDRRAVVLGERALDRVEMDDQVNRAGLRRLVARGRRSDLDGVAARRRKTPAESSAWIVAMEPDRPGSSHSASDYLVPSTSSDKTRDAFMRSDRRTSCAMRSPDTFCLRVETPSRQRRVPVHLRSRPSSSACSMVTIAFFGLISAARARNSVVLPEFMARYEDVPLCPTAARASGRDPRRGLESHESSRLWSERRAADVDHRPCRHSHHS